LQAFAINLGRAPERWRHVEQLFAQTGYPLVRVDAVDGATLAQQTPEYAERSFFRRHSRSTNLLEVGCYLSHLRALEMFLATSDRHALICEDDVELCAGATRAIEALMRVASTWDIARLSGLKEAPGVNALRLSAGYFLRVNLGRLKGAGAYIVNRRAAQKLVRHLRPMRVPFDHAIDREWVCGLSAVSVSPFPIDQTGSHFRTSIQRGPARKLSSSRRFAFTYPYQGFNEISRWFFRAVELLAFYCKMYAPGASR
jgi:glycosyl transferase family 25